MKLRLFHRALGLTLLLFVLNVSATGMLRANAKWLYWKDRPPLHPPAALEAPQIPWADIFEIAKAQGGIEPAVRRAELRSFFGKTVYFAELQNKKKLLIDAATGETVLIDAAKAEEIAADYMPPAAKPSSVERVEGYRARRISEPRPAWKIRYADDLQTEIYVDRESGEALSVMDRGRRFSVWVNRLHELDFLGASRWFLLALGLGLSGISLTGLALALPARKKPSPASGVSRLKRRTR
ncbi:MAG TPA: PepSY domain-containing protein [Opitutaceae bacterium]|nr:PepSY domain-containing protein [Opitutaceae bacterium]